MGFSNNYKEARENNFDNKPEGEYEVIIKEIKEHKYVKDGVSKLRLSLKLLIRNDVDQPGRDGYLFHSYFQRKEPTKQDFYMHGFSFGQMMWLSQQANIPDGKEYESFEDFCDDLTDKCVRVKMEYDNDRTYNGKPQEKITAIMKTKNPECRHKYKPDPNIRPDTYAQPENRGFASGAVYSALESIDDEDLPF